MVFSSVDGVAGELAAVDEDSARGPLQQNSVVAVVADFEFRAVGVFGSDQKFGGRVVVGVVGRISVLERYGVLHHHRVDRHWAGFGLAQRPGCDIDVVRAPIGELAAGVLPLSAAR